MKLPFAIGAAAFPGTIASVIGTASALAMVAGAAYIVDCRLSGGSADQCWLTGLPLMGIGAAGKGGFNTGYATYNPTLRRPEDEPTAESEPSTVELPKLPELPAVKRRTTSTRR